MQITRVVWLMVGALLWTGLVVMGIPAQADEEKAAVARAVREYTAAWYAGDEGRLATVLHPRFIRRIITRNRLGDEFFREDSRERMLEIVRKWGGDRPTPPAERQIRLVVLDVARETASARVDSAYYVEHIHLARDEGRWLVVDVLWENVPNPRPVVELDVSLLAACTGEYKAENGVRLVVTAGDNCLLVKGPAEPASMIFPESATVFSPHDFKARFEFVRNEQGAIVRLRLEQRCREFVLKKVR